ncbi:MAG: hypothetical protein WBL80_10145 [Erysipelotrichaceae bacterium]
MKLTKREQFLLFILTTALVIAAFFFFVFSPLNKDIAANQAKLNTLKAEKMTMEAQLMIENKIKTDLEAVIVTANEKFSHIESPLFSAEFERWTLPFLTRSGVIMTGFEVGQPAISKPENPTYVNAGFPYKVRELVDSYNQIKAGTTTIPTTDAELVKTIVTFKFQTSYAVFSGLLDTIAFWDTTAFVTHANYDFTQGSGIVTVDYYTITKLTPQPNTIPNAPIIPVN